MSRSSLVISCALLALLFNGATAFAAATGPMSVICPRVANAPALDGRLDDWPALPQIVISTVDEWRPAATQYSEYGGPQDISADVRLAWDSGALYLAVETRDDSLVRVRSASQIDQGDSIVLSLAGESQEPNQFVVSLLTSASLVWRAQPTARAGESRAIGRAIWARQDEGGGTRVTYELAIPWDELAPIRPIPGQEFSFTISVCDDDGAGMKGCLERSLPVVFASQSDGALLGPSRPSALTPSFAKPDVIRFDRKSFIIGGKPVLLFAGRVDYARLPKAVWADRLAALTSAGMNAVDVTVPWSHHQPTPGQPDLSDLREFLDLCKQSALWVQLGLGPYAGDDWEAGAVPGWLIARAGGENEQQSVDTWYRTLLPLVKPYQVTNAGPVAAVVIRPLPDVSGAVSAGSLQELIELVRGAGIQVPLLAANAAAARENTKRSLTNLLDTIAFYSPVTAADMLPRLRDLAREENGPAVISGLQGSYRDPIAARQSASLVKIALGSGATAVSLSDFAPGHDPNARYTPGEVIPGVVDPAGLRTAGYREAKLVGDSVRLFGPELAKAVSAEGVVKADDPEIRVAARLSDRSAFLFLWDEKGAGPRQVRLIYSPPGTTAALAIPEAGAISLPPGCAKMLAIDVPVGRGTLRYTTSEIAAIHNTGDRTLLVLYGDVDTPGETALRLPGPPLVLGQVTRQRWDAERNTLVLDYFHSQMDQYLLVDGLQIAILSRDRAATAGQVTGDADTVTISAGAAVVGGSIGPDSIEAIVECPPGVTQLTAALPRSPASVTVDGKPVEFTFPTPARVLVLPITTQSYDDESRGSSLIRLGRVIIGGPPKLVAAFDRGWFTPDSEAKDGPSRSAVSVGRPPEALGLTTGAFVRLRTSFESAAPLRLALRGSDDPMLVSVNGKIVPELSGAAKEREADISSLLASGTNRLEVLVDVLPRADGVAGLRGAKQLPEITLTSAQGDVPIAAWEVCPGTAGEADGWTALDLDASQWHLLRFGPWRAQGRDLADVLGVGWYRVPFGIPRPGEWRIPYYLTANLHGAGVLYLNGTRYAGCNGNGAYKLALPSPPLQTDAENILAAALYGVNPDTGIYSLTIAADRQHMTRRHTVSVKF